MVVEVGAKAEADERQQQRARAARLLEDILGLIVNEAKIRIDLCEGAKGKVR